MDWTRLLDRLPPGLLFAVTAAAGFLLFGPVERMGLTRELDGYRVPVAAVGLVAAGLLVAHVTSIVANRFRRWRRERADHKQLRRRLQELTADEKEVLAKFVAWRRRTLYLPAFDDAVEELKAVGILEEGGISRAKGYAKLPYRVVDWAWDLLVADPSLVGIDASELAEARIEDAMYHYGADEDEQR